MNKLLGNIMGVIFAGVFIFMTMGMIYGKTEADSYVNARTEYLNLVREAKPEELGIGGTGKSVNLVQFEEDLVQTFGGVSEDVVVNISFAPNGDVDGNGEVDYGDTVRVTMDVVGSGSFNFRRRLTADDAAEGRTEDRPVLYSERDVLISNRRVGD